MVYSKNKLHLQIISTLSLTLHIHPLWVTQKKHLFTITNFPGNSSIRVLNTCLLLSDKIVDYTISLCPKRWNPVLVMYILVQFNLHYAQKYQSLALAWLLHNANCQVLLKLFSWIIRKNSTTLELLLKMFESKSNCHSILWSLCEETIFCIRKGFYCC